MSSSFPTPPSRTFTVGQCWSGRANAFKTPSEYNDWAIDWSKYLDLGELITSSSWAVSGGPDSALIIPLSTINSAGTGSSVWLSGGTPGTGRRYIVTNTILTDNSPARELQASFYCNVRSMNSL